MLSFGKYVNIFIEKSLSRQLLTDAAIIFRNVGKKSNIQSPIDSRDVAREIDTLWV